MRKITEQQQKQKLNKGERITIHTRVVVGMNKPFQHCAILSTDPNG